MTRIVDLIYGMDEGGYLHAPDDLSYGVDIKKIRWCGILQVQFINQRTYFGLPFIHVIAHTSLPLFDLGSSEDSFGVLCGCSDRNIHHKGATNHCPVWSIRHIRRIPVAVVHDPSLKFSSTFKHISGFLMSECTEHFWPFPMIDRLGGYIAFVIYMVTTFSLYVPDWSFVYHNDGDVNDGKRFTVPGTCPELTTAEVFRI